MTVTTVIFSISCHTIDSLISITAESHASCAWINSLAQLTATLVLLQSQIVSSRWRVAILATTHGCSVSAIIDETLASRSNFIRAIILLFDLVVSQGCLVVVGTVLELRESLHILRLLELLRSQFSLDLEQL